MARPRKNEHIKEQLLEVGLETLLAKGYHGTGIKEILDKLGVPKGSFYHYFKSKEAFAAEIIGFYAADLNHRLLSNAAGGKKTGLDAIKAAFGLMVEEYQQGKSGCILGALASEIAETSELCRLAIFKEVEYWNRMVALLIEQGQKSGEVRSDLDSNTLSRLLWNCWEGGVLRIKIEASPAPVEEVLNVMFDAILCVNK